MRRHAELLTFAVWSIFFVSCGTSDARTSDAAVDASRDAAQSSDTQLLLFTRTTGFRHESISNGVAMLRHMATLHGWHLDETEDAAAFAQPNLSRYSAVIWLSTTGDVLGEDEQLAFENYVRGGGGYVGIHAASDCEYDWPWYESLVGAYFDAHPDVQSAAVHVETSSHPIVAGLPASFTRVDEWYNFRSNPRPSVDVLLTLDESTYEGGTMGSDHPIAWAHEVDDGRAFYTALGHTPESYTEPEFIALVDNAIRWTVER